MSEIINFRVAGPGRPRRSTTVNAAPSTVREAKVVEGLIYDALSCDDSLHQLPASLAAACNASSCVLWWRDRDGRPDVLAELNLSATWRADILAADRDSEWSAVMAARSDQAFLITKLDPSMVKLRQKLLHDDETASSMGLAISTPEGSGFVAINRGYQQPPFRLAEQILVARWKGPLQRLLVTRGRILMEQHRADSSAARLNSLGLGVLQVRSDGRIAYANAAAVRILRCGDGLTGHRGVLGCADREAAAALSCRIGRAVSAGGENCLFVPIGDDGQFYRLSISPLRHGGEEVLVLVEDCDRKRFESPVRLEQLLGLTHAEAQLAANLCEGLSIEAIAERRGVSRNTARSQMQRVLEKAGVSRQAELVGLLCSIPRAMPPAPNSGVPATPGPIEDAADGYGRHY
jgi:DNA-binding CsgD family transcriptional regulator/PAS domain-containing protein